MAARATASATAVSPPAGCVGQASTDPPQAFPKRAAETLSPAGAPPSTATAQTQAAAYAPATPTRETHSPASTAAFPATRMSTAQVARKPKRQVLLPLERTPPHLLLRHMPLHQPVVPHRRIVRLPHRLRQKVQPFRPVGQQLRLRPQRVPPLRQKPLRLKRPK